MCDLAQGMTQYLKFAIASVPFEFEGQPGHTTLADAILTSRDTLHFLSSFLTL